MEEICSIFKMFVRSTLEGHPAAAAALANLCRCAHTSRIGSACCFLLKRIKPPGYKGRSPCGPAGWWVYDALIANRRQRAPANVTLFWSLSNFADSRFAVVGAIFGQIGSLCLHYDRRVWRGWLSLVKFGWVFWWNIHALLVGVGGRRE